MNKTDLVNAIAMGAGLSKVDAKKALDATLAAIEEALKKDDKVALVGFGTFEVAKRAERQGIILQQSSLSPSRPRKSLNSRQAHSFPTL